MLRLLCLTVLAVVALAGCSPFGSGAFQCANNAQCDEVTGGVCESTGFCSFPDGSCTSGQRYGDRAGDGLAEICVGEEPAPPVPDAGGGTDSPPAGPFCDPAGGEQVACFRFEGNTTDESGNNNNPGSSSESYATGIDGMALRTQSDTELDFADSNTWDVVQFTFEAWLNPEQIPGGGRAGVFDANGQYGIFIHPGGELECTAGGINGSPIRATGVLTVGTWTHIACVYDGSEFAVYVDGVSVQSTAASGAPGTGGTEVSLAGNSPDGDPYIGLMDNVRLWNVGRTAAQICAAANCQ